MPFSLHPTLAADTAVVTQLPLCLVLLMNDRQFPWLVLVPQRDALRDLDELSEADFDLFQRELRTACAVLRSRYAPFKLNVASLGNQVPQLHVHVIGRFEVDAAWPRPVWGVVPRSPFPPDQLEREVSAVRQAFHSAEVTPLGRGESASGPRRGSDSGV